MKLTERYFINVKAYKDAAAEIEGEYTRAMESAERFKGSEGYKELKQKAEDARAAALDAERKTARYEQERQDKTLVAQAMRGILGDDGATAREKIFAALTLDNIEIGDLVPWRAARLYDSDADTAAFARAVNAITEAENKGNT